MAETILNFGRCVCDVAGSTRLEADVSQYNRHPLFVAQETVLGYTVPASKKLRLQELLVTAYHPYTPRLSGLLGSAGLMFGTVYLRVDGVDKAEFRVFGSPLPLNLSAGDEINAPWASANQLITFQNGITINSGQTVALFVAEVGAGDYGIRWRGSFHGKLSSVAEHKFGAGMVASASAEAILSYTPGSDFTLKGFNISAEMFSDAIGYFAVEVNGQVVFDSPMAYLDNSQSMFNDDAFEAPGSFAVPLQGVELREGDSIRILADPVSAHNAVFAAQLVGSLSSVGSMRPVNLNGGIAQ